MTEISGVYNDWGRDYDRPGHRLMWVPSALESLIAETPVLQGLLTVS